MNIRVDGDSFAEGGYGEAKTLSVLTAEEIGADLTNKAQGGWMINDSWQSMVNTGERFLEVPSPYDVHLINLGYNDVRKNGNKPNFAEETAHRMKAMIAYISLGDMRDENDAGITWTGSWSLVSFGADAQGRNLKCTGTPGSSAGFEIDGDTFILGTFVLAKDAGTLKIEVDGKTKFEEAMQAGDSGYTPTAVILRGLGEGIHKVVVSKSDAAGGLIYIDYIGTEAENPPRVLVDSITYMREDQYGTFPDWMNGSKEAADKTNKALEEMIKENFGSNVELVNQSSFDPNVLDNILSDDLVHPNTEGHKIMADNIISAYYRSLSAV